MESSVNSRLAGPGYGAFVISLDFELHWGVRDHERPNGPYGPNLLGARKAIPRLLEMFERFGIPATWAIVGFLFARSREERRKFEPALRPRYHDRSLDAYAEPIGNGEDDDPLHFAPSLIDQIQRCPQQEIATHTFSHHYCREPGQTVESFRADLNSAIAIAAERGIQFRSIIFPRNQVNPEYTQAVLDAGITCYRGSEQGGMNRGITRRERTLGLRVGRVAATDIDLSLKRMEEKRLKRMTDQFRLAALEDAIFHIWFHPHNFGVNLEQNLGVLERILQEFAFAREHYGMRSLSMDAVARMVREGFRLPIVEHENTLPPTAHKESVPA